MRDMSIHPLERLRAARQSWPFGNVVEIEGPSGIAGFMVDMFFEHTDESIMAGEIERFQEIESQYLDMNGLLLSDKERPTGKLNRLPTEFYAHQLLEVDASDPASVYAFARSWGLPFSPLRYSPHCICPEGFAVDEALEAIEGTRRLESDYSVLYSGRIISQAEAASTIELLQMVVEQLFAVVRAELSGRASQDGLCVDPINAVSCNIYVLDYFPCSNRTIPGYVPLGTLTSAIANQIIDVVNDRAEWKVCACEGCEKPFKHKQTDRRNPDSKAQFCCQKCAERQRKRNQRANSARLGVLG